MYWENQTEESWNNLTGYKENRQGRTNFLDNEPVIYFDMDGCLAKWLKYGDWTKPHYYRDLPANEKIVDFAKALFEKGYQIKILSKAMHSAIQDKYEWLQEHMPFVNKEDIYFVPYSEESKKTAFIPKIGSLTYLIDDYNPNLNEWRKEGGVCMKCITEVNNINPVYNSIFAASSIEDNLKRLEDDICAKKSALFFIENSSFLEKDKSEIKNEPLDDIWEDMTIGLDDNEEEDMEL